MINCQNSIPRPKKERRYSNVPRIRCIERKWLAWHTHVYLHASCSERIPSRGYTHGNNTGAAMLRWVHGFHVAIRARRDKRVSRSGTWNRIPCYPCQTKELSKMHRLKSFNVKWSGVDFPKHRAILLLPRPGVCSAFWIVGRSLGSGMVPWAPRFRSMLERSCYAIISP